MIANIGDSSQNELENIVVNRGPVDATIDWQADPARSYDVMRGSSRNDLITIATGVTPPYTDAKAPGGQVYVVRPSLGLSTKEKPPLHPEHRWDLGQQPPNLLDDPENFDPSTTNWDLVDNITYAGAVDNVGPNGETAYRFDFSQEAAVLRNIFANDDQSIVGFYVRAVSGTCDVDVAFGSDASPVKTIDTSWQWVTYISSGNTPQLRYRGGNSSNAIYVLRAGLNRGTEFNYSTQSEEPQTIPDIIGGADLTNGSTNSADTNDLKFQAPRGVVSDGDDYTSQLAESESHGITLAMRVYVPTGLSDGRHPFSGSSNNGWDIAWHESFDQWQVFWNENGGFTSDRIIINDTAQGTWTSLVLTTTAEFKRLQVKGEVKTFEHDYNIETSGQRLITPTSGIKVSHVEAYPVLTEQEAEAVRQRLANTDGHPEPTERWDFSSETNPHNLLKQSEDITASNWKTKGRSSVSSNVDTDPNGGSSADKFADNGGQLPIVRQEVVFKPNRRVALVGYFKSDVSNKFALRLDNNDGNSNFEQYFQPFDLSSGSIGTGFYATDQGYIVDGSQNVKMQEVGNGWYRCYVSVDMQNGGYLDFYTVELLDNNGERISSTGASNNDYSILVWGNQAVYGNEPMPPYVATTNSTAFPQTVPALRDSGNDLTLGSTTSSDTNDPDWVAPIGVKNGGDDKLWIPERLACADVMTLIVRFGDQSSDTKASVGLLNENGYTLSENNSFNVRDVDKNTESASYGPADETAIRTHSIMINRIDKVAHAAVGINSATHLDLSNLGEIRSGDLLLIAKQNTVVTHAEIYTRALTPSEALAARKRIIDNPNSTLSL